MVRVLHVIHTLFCPFLSQPNTCRKCYVRYNIDRGTLKPGRLDLSLLEDYIARLEPEWVALGGGEPLADFEHTVRTIELAKKYSVKVEVTTSGYNTERLTKLAELVDHVQLSVGGDRYVNVEALELMSKLGRSWGVNILLSDELVERLPSYVEYIAKKYRPRQMLPIVPRIYRLSPEAFKKYVAQTPVLLALSVKHSFSLLFDCVTAQALFGYEPPDDEDLVVLPSGKLAICSTYPHIKSHRECPDAKYYRGLTLTHNIGGQVKNRNLELFL